MNNVSHGLILTGGKSRRMGMDKSNIQLQGMTQIERCVRRLLPFVNKVFISKRQDQVFSMEGVFEIDDIYTNVGPIGGILSAMETYPGYSWLVCAVDLPKICDRTIRELLEHFEPEYEVIVPTVDGVTIEPTFALYNEGILSQLQSAIDNDQRGLQKILSGSNCKIYNTVYPEDLFNMNTPEDLQKIKE